MKVEIWSDIVCPFCYIGKRKFENALKEFEHKEQVEVEWKSFQLDPDVMPVAGQSLHQYLADRKGVSLERGKEMNDYMSGVAKEVGLEYNFDTAIVNNTMNAHRLLHLALKHGVQNETKEALFKAYYTHSKDIGDTETLVAIGDSTGLDADEIRTMLVGRQYIQEVQMEQQRAQELGIQGVPFFVFNNKYGVSGAQPTEVFAEVLEKVWEEEKPVLEMVSEGSFCTPDGVCS